MPDGNVERLIRSVTYRHDGDVPVAGARTLTFELMMDWQAAMQR